MWTVCSCLFDNTICLPAQAKERVLYCYKNIMGWAPFRHGTSPWRVVLIDVVCYFIWFKHSSSIFFICQCKDTANQVKNQKINGFSFFSPLNRAWYRAWCKVTLMTRSNKSMCPCFCAVYKKFLNRILFVFAWNTICIHRKYKLYTIRKTKDIQFCCWFGGDLLGIVGWQ